MRGIEHIKFWYSMFVKLS